MSYLWHTGHMEGLTSEVRFRPNDAADQLEMAPLGQIDGQTIIDSEPVRQPPGRKNQKHFPGLFWFSTTHRSLVYESLLERDRLWLADFDPGVRAAVTQPFHVTGRDGPHTRKHVPDILLQHADESYTVVDVKPRALLEKQQVKEQFEWTGELCRLKGWTYEVWSGADTIVLRNIRYIAIGRRALIFAPDLIAEVGECAQPGMTLGQAESEAKHVAADDQIRLASMALLWSHQWRIDLTSAISSTTTLLGEGERSWTSRSI